MGLRFGWKVDEDKGNQELKRQVAGERKNKEMRYAGGNLVLKWVLERRKLKLPTQSVEDEGSGKCGWKGGAARIYLRGTRHGGLISNRSNSKSVYKLHGQCCSLAHCS